MPAHTKTHMYMEFADKVPFGSFGMKPVSAAKVRRARRMPHRGAAQYEVQKDAIKNYIWVCEQFVHWNVRAEKMRNVSTRSSPEALRPALLGSWEPMRLPARWR